MRSVDRSKFHLGDNASVAKIAQNDGPAVKLSRTSESEQRRPDRVLLDILNWSSHLQPSGVRHSSTSVDAAPPSPQEVQVEWGRNLLGRGREREGESLFKWFRALSLTTPFCTHSAAEGGREGGREGRHKGLSKP